MARISRYNVAFVMQHVLKNPVTAPAERWGTDS